MYRSVAQTKMRELLSGWEASRDPRGAFLSCYERMTSRMLQGVNAGRFRDPVWIQTLLETFAGYYFSALQEYNARSTTIPAVWRFTFEQTEKGNLHILQKLLLGMNAHINYDLVFALRDSLEPEWPPLSSEFLNMRRSDHLMVNTIIGETIDEVQDEIIEPESPFLRIVDNVLGPVDEFLLSSLINSWRDDVWDKALLLLHSPDEEHSLQAVEALGDSVIAKARLICFV